MEVDTSAADTAIFDLLNAAREHAAGTLDRSGFLQACCDRIRERMAVRAAAISLGGAVWSSGLEPAEATRYQTLFERCQPARESSLLAHPVSSGFLYLVGRLDAGVFDGEAEEALRLLAAEMT